MVQEDMEWTGVAQGRSHWRAVVNTVMNLWVREPAFSLNIPCRFVNRRVLQKTAVSILRIQVVQIFGSKSWWLFKKFGLIAPWKLMQRITEKVSNYLSLHILYPSGLWSSIIIFGLRRPGIRLITRINQYRSEEAINLVQIDQVHIMSVPSAG